MPIAAPGSWTDADGIFVPLGKIVKSLNAYRGDYAAYDTRCADVENGGAVSPSITTARLTEGVKAVTDQAKGYLDLIIASHRQFLLRRLMDYTVTLQYLQVAAPSALDVAGVSQWPQETIEAVLTRLMRVFGDNSQTVKRSVVTVGAVTAQTNNVGNGTIVFSKVLDGVTRPGDFYPASTTYAGVDSELALTETHTFQCVADRQANPGAVAASGQEVFRWSGRALAMGLTVRTEGSGTRGANVRAIAADTVLANGDFESWGNTANVPNQWSIMASGGTAGTHIFQEATNYYRGAYGVKFTGDGAQATIGIQQSFNIVNLQPRRAYVLSVRVKASSAAPAAGDLTVICTGTGYTAGSTEKVSVGHAALTTSWALKSAIIVTPSDIPSDFALAVKVTGTLTNTVSVYVDDVFFAPMDYHGGIGAKAIPGSTPFKVGDLFSADMSNDNAGIWNTAFRRLFFVQLPSAAAASETLSDTLCS